MSKKVPQLVAVLMGGRSAERGVSLDTADQCTRALQGAGYDARPIDAGRDLAHALVALKPGVVFNALHGQLGEDGCVQGILEWLRIPYTHSGVRASANAFHKEQAKALFRAEGLPVAPSFVTTRQSIAARHPMPPPYVVKPVSDGSSVGIHIVQHADAGPVRLGADAPARLMVETYVPGCDLTTTVLGGRALGVTEIVVDGVDGWYDYAAKYQAGGSRHVLPANIPPQIAALCEDYAVRAHRVLGCRGISRTDFRWDAARGRDGLFLLEINTQPGMTPTSLSPEQAAAVGIDLAALCAWLVEDASCDR